MRGSVGDITRPDGSSQVTLNGAPLYRFYQDTAADTANGNGIRDSFGGVELHVARRGAERGDNDEHELRSLRLLRGCTGGDRDLLCKSDVLGGTG